MRCAPDTRCERIQVNCIRAPCPASGRCVPINETEPPRLSKLFLFLIKADTYYFL